MKNESLPAKSQGAELHALWGVPAMTAKLQRRHLRHLCRNLGPVLEIGADRGVVLRLLAESGQEAYGIDLDPARVDAGRAAGLDMRLAEGLEHLRSLPDASLGGLMLAHVIEHLTADTAIALIREAGRTLRPGARFVIVTPNTRDLRTAERFWYDPTHVRPYPAKLIIRLLAGHGFDVVEVSDGAEPSSSMLRAVAKWMVRAWFLGFMFRGDQIVVGQRSPMQISEPS